MVECQLSLFYDQAGGGFFSTAENAAHIILRLKDGMDSSEPSTNGVSAVNLYRLSSLLADDDYATKAKETVASFESEILQYPWLFPSFMPAIAAGKLGVEGIVVTLAESTSLSQSDKGKEKQLEEARGITRIKEFEKTPRGGLSTFIKMEKEGNEWLRSRNSLLTNFGLDGKGRVLICADGVCKEERDLAGSDDVVKSVPSEIIKAAKVETVKEALDVDREDGKEVTVGALPVKDLEAALPLIAPEPTTTQVEPSSSTQQQASVEEDVASVIKDVAYEQSAEKDGVESLADAVGATAATADKPL